MEKKKIKPVCECGHKHWDHDAMGCFIDKCECVEFSGV